MDMRMRFSDASQKLISKLIIEERSTEAFELTKSLLEIKPDPEAGTSVTDDLFEQHLTPQTRLSETEYVRFLEEVFPKLVALDPDRALVLISDLLNDYTRLSYPNDEKHSYEDVSQVWRPAIENHSQNRQREDVQNALVSAVRDTALGMVTSNPTSLKKIISGLEGYKWVIFRRLSMYILSENPTVEPGLVVGYLSNAELLEDIDFRHEYAILGQKGFGVLNAEQQESVLRLVENAKRMTDAVEKDKKRGGLTDEQAVVLLDVWRRDRLSHFKDYLVGDWKSRYETLVSKHGEPDHPDFSSYSTSYRGPTSSVRAKDLIDMGAMKLLEYLRTWEPEKDQYGFGPTKEGLGRELSAAVQLEPKYFESIIESFKGLDPTYVRAYLDGFYNLTQKNIPLDWEKILSLSEWAVSQTRDITDRKGGIMDQDPDWGWTRRTIASLIERGLNTNTIPVSFRKLVWTIIEQLTDDPNPTSAEERTKDGTPIDDAYSLSINTVRGEAMNAVIEYALWTYRILEQTVEGKESLKSGFSVMPEVKKVLDKHLDPAVDPAVAVRAVYGRFFPWLLLMDSAWVTASLDKILPPGKFDDLLYHAAWQSYIFYVSAYDTPLPVLRERYREAIQNLGKVRDGHRANQDEKLTQHLMAYYSRGLLALTDDMFIEFWDKAEPKLRQYALENIGHIISSDDVVLPVDVLARLKALWDQRLAVAKAAKGKANHSGEMMAFGWWFSSGKFDTQWSCQQYLAALDIGESRTDSDYFVSKRLADVVKTFPVEAIKILKKLVLGDRQTWLIYRNDEEVSSIIREALHAPDAEAQKEAKDLVNRLVANGHVEFKNLLQQPPATPPESI
jgi:hypothetical protein